MSATTLSQLSFNFAELDEAEPSPGESPVTAEVVQFREYTDSDI
jgi:hypothetical protein